MKFTSFIKTTDWLIVRVKQWSCLVVIRNPNSLLREMRAQVGVRLKFSERWGLAYLRWGRGFKNMLLRVALPNLVVAGHTIRA